MSVLRKPKPFLEVVPVVAAPGKVAWRKRLVQLTWREAVSAWAQARAMQLMYRAWLAKTLWRA